MLYETGGSIESPRNSFVAFNVVDNADTPTASNVRATSSERATNDMRNDSDKMMIVKLHLELLEVQNELAEVKAS